MKNNFLTRGDFRFIRTLGWIFKVKRIYINWSNSQKKWPDIWVEFGNIPIITVTAEWARQEVAERRKRLVHEYLHIFGMQHGKHGNYDYNTIPEKDTYSKMIYRGIIKRRRK